MWNAGGHEAAQMRDLMTFALNRSGVAAIMMRDSGEFVFIANLPDCWTIPTSAPPTRQSVFGDALGGRIAELAAETVASGKPQSFETAAPDDRHFEFGLDRVTTGQDRFLLLTVIEVTEERRREQRLRVVLRELSHRSKNLLAIILSVASQTARSANELKDFLPSFRGRVYSISHSQDLITDTNWHGAFLWDLVRAQAGKYHERPEQGLTLRGTNPLLSPGQALHVGLAIHELFVDAVALGEISRDFPRVAVTCSEKPYDGKPGLEIEWRQTNPEPASDGGLDAAKSEGFHSAVLNRIAPTAVGGAGHYEHNAEGPYYRLHFPVAE